MLGFGKIEYFLLFLGIQVGILTAFQLAPSLSSPRTLCSSLFETCLKSNGKSILIRSGASQCRPRLQNSYSAARWEDQFNELLSFKEEYGHVNIPQKPTRDCAATNTRLAHFVKNMRAQYRYRNDPTLTHRCFLTETRIRRLNSIGFIWDIRDMTWNTRFDELSQYFARNGHCSVTLAEDPKLQIWSAYQRRRYRKAFGNFKGSSSTKELSNAQIEKLSSIGFQWDPQSAKWWQRYHELLEFGRERGHFQVPPSYSPRLNNWANHQRRLCREYILSARIEGNIDVHVSGLDEERRNALQKIDFCRFPDLLSHPTDQSNYISFSSDVA